jgi:hypothetical protein
MAANPVISLGSKRAHTETTVLGLLITLQQQKPEESRYSLRQLSDHRQMFLMGKLYLPSQLIGCVALLPSDPTHQT